MNIVALINSLSPRKQDDYSVSATIEEGWNLSVIFSEKVDVIPLMNHLNEEIKTILLTFSDEEKLIDKLYEVLRIYYHITDDIANYIFGRESEGEKCFSIYFDVNYLPKFLQFFEQLFTVSSDKKCSGFSYSEQLSEDKLIRITQSNTKTRRLGYLKLIISLFKQSTYFPVNFLEKKVEAESIKHQDELKKYGQTKDNKGLIKETSNGSSAKPYIDLLENINLLTRVSNSYILTKQCKIYYHLLETQVDQSSGVVLFELAVQDQLFFLRQLLVTDALYLLIILDIIHITEGIESMPLKKLFVKCTLNELDRNLQFTKNSSLKIKINEIKKRIQSWTKPLVYLEHIIEPRLNWLLDLGLITQTKKQYSLSVAGEKLMVVLSSIYKKELNKLLFLPSFIEKCYFKAFSFVYDLNKFEDVGDDIDEYLLEAFRIFRTDAPNRIAASQAIDYVCFKSFLRDNRIIEFDNLKINLSAKKTAFAMDWFKTENDGTLYLKK